MSRIHREELEKQQRYVKAFGDMVNAALWNMDINEKNEIIDIFWSEEFRRMLDFKSAKAFPNTIESWADRLHPDDKERTLKHFLKAVGSKSSNDFVYDIQYRMLKNNDRYCWYRSVAQIEDVDEHTRRLYGILMDVSAEKKIEEQQALLERSLTYSNYFLSTFFSAYYINFDTQECAVYKRSEQLQKDYPIGTSYLTSISKHIKKTVHPDDRAALLEAIQPERMKELLKKGDYTHVFRDISYKPEAIIRMQVIRGADENHAAFGFSNITEEFHKERRHLMGAVPISSDILSKANIGLWAFEMDEGKPPRMYVDAAMMKLIGLETQVSPEETYHAWYDHVDAGSYVLVEAAVEKMMTEHAEVQYPWHHPNGTTMIVRCGGVRNPEYTAGIRIEGTHQNVTEVLRFDKEEADRIRKANELDSVKRTMNLVFALSDEYDPILVIDPESGEYECVMSRETAIDIDSKKPLRGENVYENFELDRLMYIHEDDREKFKNFFTRDTMRNVAKNGVILETENRWYSVDEGRYRWKYNKVVRMVDETGKAFVVIGCVDTTEAKEQEQEILRIKQQEKELIGTRLRADALAFVADHDPDIDKFMDFFGKRIIETTSCDQVIFRNTEGHRIVVNGVGIEDIPQDICSKCDYSSFMSENYGDGGSVIMSDCSKGYNGVMAHPACPAKSSYMQQIHSGGELVGLLTIHYLKGNHDFISNEIETMKIIATYLGLLLGRIAAKKVEREKLQAESSNAAKTQFLFNMSHDIRTPMNAILGYTDIALRHENEPSRIKDCLKKIKRSGNHLLNLINDILEMSRIEAGKIEISEEPMDIRQAIDGVCHLSHALAIPKHIKFEVKTGKLVNPYVYADELHLNEVLINIISNAMKYSYENGTVTYSIDQIDSNNDGRAWFRFTVEDNGIGMSEEFQKHLFETFTRERTATVSKQEGTGIGLSIVKRIVDLCGGRIEVVSSPGVGSVFTVEMPFKIMDEAAIDQFIENSPAPEVHKKAKELNGKKVLLVEDNEMNREIAEDILKEAGFSIDTAEDGEVAVKVVEKMGPDHYDFILMDIQMPVMDGYEATKAIRSLKGGEKATIIALSANAFDEDKQKSLEVGINAHIAKPIDVKELFAVMNDQLFDYGTVNRKKVANAPAKHKKVKN